MAQDIDPQVVEYVHDVARRARAASRELALLNRGQKDAALLSLAEALDAGTERIVSANREDVERERAGGMGEGLLDRLTLTTERVRAVAQALRDVAALPDPVGE